MPGSNLVFNICVAGFMFLGVCLKTSDSPYVVYTNTVANILLCRTYVIFFFLQQNEMQYPINYAIYAVLMFYNCIIRLQNFKSTPMEDPGIHFQCHSDSLRRKIHSFGSVLSNKRPRLDQSDSTTLDSMDELPDKFHCLGLKDEKEVSKAFIMVMIQLSTVLSV